ncbi:MAG TPA: ATP-binding protein [Rhodocyclaceae bacterium]|nr:ATP-binding protein [Rhodocyclaceae bacterium]
MKHWDLGHRVLVAAVAPAVVIAVVLALFFAIERIEDLDKELHEHGRAIAGQLAPACEYGVFSQNREVLAQLADAAVSQGGVQGAAVFDRNGDLLARSGYLEDAALHRAVVPLPESLQPVRLQRGLVYSALIGRLHTAKDDLVLAESGTQSDGAHPLGMVVVYMSLQPLEEERREVIGGAALITSIGLILAVLFARRLSMGIRRPVFDLAATVAKIEAGDLQARASIDAGGVLKVLEAGINQMAAALEAAQRDLQQRIAAATAELQTQKELAERANRTKTQFLAAASHDLRQPMQALGLFVSALRMRTRDEDTERLVQRIERALNALETVLDALLDISRLDAGIVTPRIESFPVSRLFESLLDTFGGAASEAGLALRIVPTRAWCRSDPLLLERVVSNLVSNALRYTRRGGVVVGCRPFGTRLRIEVWDSGPGIPANQLHEIFREFVQLHNAEPAREKGLGLGLAIVERLSRLLAHPVTVDSWPGSGTVFRVAVPRGRPLSIHQTAGDAPEPPEDLSGLSVLVVDDDQDVLDSTEAFLTELGATVMPCKSGAQARTAAGRSLVDFVISDYRLPDTDGVTLVKELRQTVGEPVPAILISGEPSLLQLPDVAESRLPVLRKPVRGAALLLEIRRLLVAVPDEPGD